MGSYKQWNKWEQFCTLQWIPAEVNTEGNECVDQPFKFPRNLSNASNEIRLSDTKVVTKNKLFLSRNHQSQYVTAPVKFRQH